MTRQPYRPDDHRIWTAGELAETTLFAKGRVCGEPHCGTILQRRNPGPMCSRHTIIEGIPTRQALEL